MQSLASQPYPRHYWVDGVPLHPLRPPGKGNGSGSGYSTGVKQSFFAICGGHMLECDGSVDFKVACLRDTGLPGLSQSSVIRDNRTAVLSCVPFVPR
jgi:hypothetical protein